MARAVRLFISSSPDLTAEREALGRAVAALPVSVGWEIKHTPRVGEDALEAAEFNAPAERTVPVAPASVLLFVPRTSGATVAAAGFAVAS